ncbi:MAG: serine/threonine protein kinase [Actinobacteria bacterium]|nr:serine/threonine protein kinase [Actinomycetota bacterium]
MSTQPSRDDLDPSFVFDYQPLDLPSAESEGATAQHTTTYWDVRRDCRGPQPLPDWVVIDAGAIDTELGVLKTGKEADVHLVRRAATDGTGQESLMAAKRYRGEERRSFHRASAYTEGRRTKKSRDSRALERRSSYGRQVAAGLWAYAEWDALNRYWAAGLPVPYPVQLDGTEILMEFIGDADGVAAPRLAQTRPDPVLLAGYYGQLVRAIHLLASHGAAHGDLSAYNVLVDGADVVIIDMPQVVDIVGNPQGREFLRRDCVNICAWFTARGLDVDGGALFTQVHGSL